MAACKPRACLLVPGTVGTGSFSNWLILGTVSLRILSFGPPGVPPFAASSLGMLKLPASLLFVAVLFRLPRSEEHTSELQSRPYFVCRLLLEKKKKIEK